MSDFFIIAKPSAVWTAENPSMPPNYLGVESLIVDGVETEDNKAKLFNGIDAWNDLDYWSPAGDPTPTFTWNVQSGTTYSLQVSDNNAGVQLTNGSAVTVTVPTGLGDTFNTLLVQMGAGQVTVVDDGSTSIQNVSGQFATSAQYAVLSLFATDTDEYVLAGSTA